MTKPSGPPSPHAACSGNSRGWCGRRPWRGRGEGVGRSAFGDRAPSGGDAAVAAPTPPPAQPNMLQFGVLVDVVESAPAVAVASSLETSSGAVDAADSLPVGVDTLSGPVPNTDGVGNGVSSSAGGFSGPLAPSSSAVADLPRRAILHSPVSSALTTPRQRRSCGQVLQSAADSIHVDLTAPFALGP